MIYRGLGIEQLESVVAEAGGDRDVLRAVYEVLCARKQLPRVRRLRAELEPLVSMASPHVEAGSPTTPPPAPAPASSQLPLPNVANATRAQPDQPPAAPGAAKEVPPDDIRRPAQLTRIRPPGTPGLPQAWAPSRNTDVDLGLPPNADLPQVYVTALDHLISEQAASGSGQRRFDLENGERQQAGSDVTVYAFPFAEDGSVFPEAEVQVEVSARRTRGTVVALEGGRILLGVEDDLGASIVRATVIIDNTALLRKLKERIEQVGKGEVPLTRPLADAAVGRVQPPADLPAVQLVGATELVARQAEAARHALTSRLTFVWGPPGCGKTTTLSVIVRSAFEAGKRVLVCSNTNKAVDQLLYKVCQTLGRMHPAMVGGQVLRLGTVRDDKLLEYEDYVTVDGIVDRLSASLTAERARAEEDLGKIDRRSASINEALKRFRTVAEARATQADWEAKVGTHRRAADEHRQGAGRAAAVVEGLDHELQRRRDATFKFLHRAEDTIAAERGAAVRAHSESQAEAERQDREWSSASAELSTAKRWLEHQLSLVAGLDEGALAREATALASRRRSLVERMREIEGQLAALRAEVTKRARIVGATCTKAFVSATQLGRFDLVIVDEASMVMAPAVWFCAGLSSERVVLSGDFRQLAPIVQTKQQAVYEALGRDPFEMAGLVARPDSRMVMLDEQHRMNPQICDLVRSSMYNGALRTAARRAASAAAQATRPPAPFDQALTVVDTSDLWPFETRTATGSRFNLMHGLLSRNLAWHLQKSGWLDTKRSLGICTAYAAQAKLIRKLLDAEALGDVQSGTVHAFQGDERRMVIIDVLEGHGAKDQLGIYAQGVPPASDGARLFNVAISRAEDHLVMLANLTYLDRHLPSGALLREVLHSMQERGSVVSGKDVLRLRPLVSDLRGLPAEVPLDVQAKTFGIFSEATFDAAILADIRAARRYVVVFSGFVTPNRVNALAPVLQAKVAAGVTVRCVTRPPHSNGTIEPARGKQALDALEAAGCIVDCRERIHQKVVLIDGEVVWHGSLNTLSHTHLSDEIMTRHAHPGVANLIAMHLARGGRRVAGGPAAPENPRCQCGKRSVYDLGRFGPYFKCEDDCGWRRNA